MIVLIHIFQPQAFCDGMSNSSDSGPCNIAQDVASDSLSSSEVHTPYVSMLASTVIRDFIDDDCQSERFQELRALHDECTHVVDNLS